MKIKIIIAEAKPHQSLIEMGHNNLAFMQH